MTVNPNRGTWEPGDRVVFMEGGRAGQHGTVVGIDRWKRFFPIKVRTDGGITIICSAALLEREADASRQSSGLEECHGY